ncbi:hypothetical protein [Azospirillum canadense]|uniref:hypothetical protein n=1 Tax=Azospirillum canadense TaxID=403962 RepID=UPI002227F758|nr:hypothetical protein [Azospirillum canadense]MCW2238174.1 hypothetical protein [Azospirillum canadense]
MNEERWTEALLEEIKEKIRDTNVRSKLHFGSEFNSLIHNMQFVYDTEPLPSCYNEIKKAEKLVALAIDILKGNDVYISVSRYGFDTLDEDTGEYVSGMSKLADVQTCLKAAIDDLGPGRPKNRKLHDLVSMSAAFWEEHVGEPFTVHFEKIGGALEPISSAAIFTITIIERIDRPFDSRSRREIPRKSIRNAMEAYIEKKFRKAPQ